MLLSVKINIPSKNMQEEFKIDPDKGIWSLKMEIISKVRNFENELNFGLVLVDHGKRSNEFLNESKTFAELGITSNITFDFVRKQRLEWFDNEQLSTNQLSTNQNTSKKITKFMIEFSTMNGKNICDRFMQILKSNDPNFLVPETGETPLSIAALNEDVDMIMHLVNNGALLDYRVGNNLGAKTPLQIAAANGKTKSVKKLIEMKSWIDAPDANNLTALFYAVEKGYGEICFRLLMSKANPNILDENSRSPLHIASHENYDGILMLLIDFGGNFQTSNNLGNTPLHIAALRNSDHCVKCFLKRGANRNFYNNLNETPLQIAENLGLDAIADYIRSFDDKNIEPPPKDPCPVTPKDSIIVTNVLRALENKQGFQIEPAPISIANQTAIEWNLLKTEQRRSQIDDPLATENILIIQNLNSGIDITESKETVVDTLLSHEAVNIEPEITNHLQNSSDRTCIKSNIISSLQTMRSKIDSFYIGEPTSNLEDLLNSFTVLEKSLQEFLNI